MLRRGALAVAIAFFSCAPVLAQDTPAGPYDAYGASIRAAGFTALIPASGAYGPGYVYRLATGDDGQPIVVTVCANAFVTSASEVDAPALAAQRFAGLADSLNVAPGAVAPDLAAAFGAELDRSRPVDVSFGKLRSFEVLQKAELSAATPAKREINRDCEFLLKQLPQSNGVFRDKVFIVVRAVAADSYSYALQQDVGAEADLTAGLATPPAPAGGWSIKRTGNATFEIERVADAPANTRVYLAAEVVQLQSWELSTQVSSGGASLSGAPTMATELGSQPARFLPVLVDLVGGATRPSTNGGSAAILLSSAGSRRNANAALCNSLFARFTRSSMEQVRASLERGAGGAPRALRPVYWPVTSQTAATNCQARLAAYNFGRAAVIKQKLGVTTLGPHLVVLQADESKAGMIDLTNVPPADYDKVVVLFRDGFSQQAVWDSRRYPPAERDGFIRAAFDGFVAPHVQAAVRILTRSTNCRNSDATDTACG